jgi:hypothetical protein
MSLGLFVPGPEYTSKATFSKSILKSKFREFWKMSFPLFHFGKFGVNWLNHRFNFSTIKSGDMALVLT